MHSAYRRDHPRRQGGADHPKVGGAASPGDSSGVFTPDAAELARCAGLCARLILMSGDLGGPVFAAVIRACGAG
ncbi:hypothetical protein [Streptomyces turgidiscabies]|uniref:Uncharacterized protein n=1 Tax=Streptomyces turgidiscabies TaxID=85558 RepID=A0ABU0RWT3_9ACTN|nr:hypothetical protein [Streptomyces turgidiscabies]MDQ0936148.1 hypothetical protein [Streptomyces turgidiscabies]